jgi:phospholipase C
VADIRDPHEAERLSSVAPDEFLKRREFLQRTAVTAGLAASMGLLLDPETIVAEAATKSRRKKLPAPKNLPIDTFVVLMMENRSFDHYLGWLPGADGRQAGLQYADKAGQLHPTHRLNNDFQGCGFTDPDHSFKGGREQFNNGKMDGFLRSGDNDAFSIGYYEKADLPFIPAAAQEFTTFDRFFCSLMASTFPNREYMHAATSYGMKANDLPTGSDGFPDNTIFDALKRKGVDSRYFYSDLPVAALWGQPGVQRSAPVSTYYSLAAAGKLPPLSFVDPSFVGEDQGTSGDEHPHGDVRTGQAFMSDVVNAFIESPHWKSGALFIVYDEWGGFFDHVPPPRVPDSRNSKDVNEDFGRMGMRVPAVVVSPYAKRKHVDHSVFGFESILKMIRYRYGIHPLTRRDAYAHNIAHAFDFDSKARLANPGLPDAPAIASQPCSISQGSLAPGLERAKEHDLATLLTSGYLDRVGFKYKPATPETMFRQPHKIVSGLKGIR